jgi:DNA-binding GntR family transcriptional regulator
MQSSSVSPDSTAERTKVERVYHHLRRLIREMKLAPGTPLQKDRIAAELGVSRAPVNEAIARLGEEMLIDIYPRHGSFVAPVRTETLRECMFIRTAIETEAVRRLTPTANESLLQRLEENVAEQQCALESRNFDRLYELDDELHGAILDATGFRRAMNLSMAARVAMDRPREFHQLVNDRAASTIMEHRRIVEAMALRDPELAAAAMRSHLTQASQALEKELVRLPALPHEPMT